MSTSPPSATAALPLTAWLRPALDLPLVEATVEVTLGARVQLASPLCTVVRGLMGQRLRELRCSTGAPSCVGCASAPGCDYARIFDGPSPHPFWIQGVPATTALEAGTNVVTRLIVAGPAHAALPYLEVAFRDALRAAGGGAHLSPTRARRSSLRELGPSPAAGPLRLRTATPLFLRGDEERCAALCPQASWLALVARAGVRRLDALVRAFAPPPGGSLPRALLPDLTAVEIVDGGWAPWRASRFSHRQHQRLPLEGIHGEAVLAGDELGALTPLLCALTVTSVGKATSLGFGGLRVGRA